VKTSIGKGAHGNHHAQSRKAGYVLQKAGLQQVLRIFCTMPENAPLPIEPLAER
jgi:hypothetical protein